MSRVLIQGLKSACVVVDTCLQRFVLAEKGLRFARLVELSGYSTGILL